MTTTKHTFQRVTVWDRSTEKRGYRCSCGLWEQLPEMVVALDRWSKPSSLRLVRERHKAHRESA